MMPPTASDTKCLTATRSLRAGLVSGDPKSVAEALVRVANKHDLGVSKGLYSWSITLNHVYSEPYSWSGVQVVLVLSIQSFNAGEQFFTQDNGKGTTQSMPGCEEHTSRLLQQATFSWIFLVSMYVT